MDVPYLAALSKTVVELVEATAFCSTVDKTRFDMATSHIAQDDKMCMDRAIVSFLLTFQLLPFVI